jgi:flavin reductase (DIM6/NTAB) family NADH-FMN oxidoreductase RutF
MQTFSPSTADSYKALARTWAATVNVVTARRGSAAEPGAPELDGFTATAFLTVSLDPPIVVVSATRTATAFTMLRDASSFVVNLLAPSQVEIAVAFAKPAAERAEAWARLKWTPDGDGAPVISGAVGAFSARVRQLVDAGDHVLVLGDVTAVHLGDGPDTLVYHNRNYCRAVLAD